MVSNRWSVFLYAMMISFFAVIVGYIITIKMDTLIENLDIQEYDTKLHSNLTEKAELAIGYDLTLNTNGSGFTNTVNCPTTVAMSGTYAWGVLENISTVSYLQNGTYVCSGSTTIGNLILSYNTGGTVFASGSYLWSDISLLPLGGTGSRTGTFSDGSGTTLSFTATGTFSNIDLDGNSDNFQSSSTGTISYPNNATDDDDLARKTIYGYIKKNTGWYNVMTMNSPIRKYIAGNTLNTTLIWALPGNTGSGYIRLDIDNPYSIKILEMNTAQFDSVKEIRVITGTTMSFSDGWIGWIMPNLSLTGAKSQAQVFDFKNKDYAIFLSFSGNMSNTGIDFMKYKISVENMSASGVYINPIDDSNPSYIKYLGTDIIIDQDKNYRYKQFEVIR